MSSQTCPHHPRQTPKKKIMNLWTISVDSVGPQSTDSLEDALVMYQGFMLDPKTQRLLDPLMPIRLLDGPNQQPLTFPNMAFDGYVYEKMGGVRKAEVCISRDATAILSPEVFVHVYINTKPTDQVRVTFPTWVNCILRAADPQNPDRMSYILKLGKRAWINIHGENYLHKVVNQGGELLTNQPPVVIQTEAPPPKRPERIIYSV